MSGFSASHSKPMNLQVYIVFFVLLCIFFGFSNALSAHSPSEVDNEEENLNTQKNGDAQNRAVEKKREIEARMDGVVSLYKDYFFRPQQEVSCVLPMIGLAARYLLHYKHYQFHHFLEMHYAETNRIQVDQEQLRRGQRRILYLPIYYDFNWWFPFHMPIDFRFGIGLSGGYSFRQWEEAVRSDFITKSKIREFQLGINYGIRLTFLDTNIQIHLDHRIVFDIIGVWDSNLPGIDYGNPRILALLSRLSLGFRWMVWDPLFLEGGYRNQLYLASRFSMHSLVNNTTIIQIIDYFFLAGGIHW